MSAPEPAARVIDSRPLCMEGARPAPPPAPGLSGKADAVRVAHEERKRRDRRWRLFELSLIGGLVLVGVLAAVAVHTG